MLNASAAGINGLSAISAAKKNPKSAAPSTRNLMRSQRPSGLRVVRSLSRGRLTNSFSTMVMSVRFLHGPRVDDVGDLVVVVLVTLRRARDGDRVDPLPLLVDEDGLVECDGLALVRLRRPRLADDHPGDEMHAVEAPVAIDGLVVEDREPVVIVRLVDVEEEVPQ